MNLNKKIFIIFMLFAATLLFSLWLFHVVLLESFYKQIKTQSIKDTADIIAESIDMIEKDDLQNVAKFVSGMALKNEISIKIIDTTSSNSSAHFNPVFSVVAEHDNLLAVIRDSELYFIYENAMENNGEVTQHYQRGSFISFHDENNQSVPTNFNDFEKNNNQNSQNNEFSPRKSFTHGAPPFFKRGAIQEILYAKIVKSSSNNEYLLLFDCVITPISSTIKTLSSLLLIQSIIFILIAAFAAKYTAKKIANPITAITNSAKHLAAGNLDTKFSGSGYLEISDLADTLNYAAGELKKSDALKKELISNTSHDLRTPLTMISGYAEVMRDIPGENTPENVQVIIDEASRLTNLVNDMLDLSKLQTGTINLDLTCFDITELTQTIIQRIEKLTEKDGFEFKFNFDNNINVCADCGKISQVIYNFLSNAVNYSNKNKKIIITQKILQDKVRLEFTDFGKGISKENLPNIWDRYYKIDTTHKRANVGSGIGLSIVKSVLELHRAKYGVISNIEKGSTFWFELDISKM